jgi:type II secretory pathway component PulF
MATFTYKAKTGNGQTVTGVLTAESQQAALRMLDDRALFPIVVNEGGQAARAR